MFLLLYPYSIIEDMQQYLPQSFSNFTLFFTVSPKHIFTLFFSKIPSGPRARHVRLYHMCITISQKHISTQFYLRIINGTLSPPHHTCITVSPKHIFTLFFSKITIGTSSPPRHTVSHVYHICITCVSQYHKNTFLLNFI